MAKPAGASSNVETFQPKLISCLKEGYDLARLKTDAIAGLTVAIVALPLSMAIAIASGASPERGIYTAIVGGFLISLLGGSRYQIGGPAGAFIVLVATIIERHGFDGLLMATILAGAIMIALGVFRLGTLIRYIPEPVTIGFTAGIAVIIFSSQIRDILGLTLAGKEPAAFIPKLMTLFHALPTFNVSAIGVAGLTLALIIGLKILRPAFPGFLIAILVAALATEFLHLPVETIGSRFGGVPSSLLAPAFPMVSLAKIQAIFPDALAIALLGSIESLLSAVVADSMTGRRHRSNTELIAQGVANIASALFGGICATGTIARTATNVRAGGTSPVAGMLHAVFLLLAMALVASLMSKIPLAALGALLAFVSWNMAEKHAFMALVKSDRAEAIVLLSTFLLTVFRDLTEGILVGVVLGAVLFAVRMARMAEVTMHQKLFDRGEGDEAVPQSVQSGDISIYRLDGPLFFGTAPDLQDVLSRVGITPKAVVFDFRNVPFADSSGVTTLERHVKEAEAKGAKVLFVGVSGTVEIALRQFGLPKARVPRLATLEAAYERVESGLSSSGAATGG